MTVRNRPSIAHAALCIMLWHCSFFKCDLQCKSSMSVVLSLTILLTTITLFYGVIVSPVRSNDMSIAIFSCAYAEQCPRQSTIVSSCSE